MGYHGVVLDDGEEFATIESGLATVSIVVQNESFSFEVTMDVVQASEVARHLQAALEALKVDIRARS